MLFNNTIINKVSDEFKKLGWEVHPPISLIGPERPVISALKNGVRFDVNVFLGEDNISNEEILSIQKQYIQQNIHCLALLEFDENHPHKFIFLSNYRTDYLKIYILRENNNELSIKDLMDYYTDDEFEFTNFIACSVDQNYLNYFNLLEKSYNDYSEKATFLNIYLIRYGILFACICEFITRFHISIMPNKLNNLLANIFPIIQNLINSNYNTSKYTAVLLYIFSIILYYIFKFKYNSIIGDIDQKIKIKTLKTLYFIFGLTLIMLSHLPWSAVSNFTVFSISHILGTYYLLECFGTYSDYLEASKLHDSLNHDYLKYASHLRYIPNKFNSK